jgi:hypothetical protein
MKLNKAFNRAHCRLKALFIDVVSVYFLIAPL